MNLAKHQKSEDARFLPTRAGFLTSFMAAVLFAILATFLIIMLPEKVFLPGSHIFFLSIGFIGIWRYGWWFTHYFRAILYRLFTFRRLRKSADMMHDWGYKPNNVYVLSTSYQIDPEVTYAVYSSVVQNAIDYGVNTIVFAAVSDQTDVDVLNHVLEDHGNPEVVEFRYMFQRGDGKRSAMAEVLRGIARCEPEPDDLVVFMDGDIRLPNGTFRRSMPFFFVEDDVGAITTDNRSIVDGDAATKEWYDLRYAQRHMLMSSISLSRRVLVLTGRFSVVRASLCTQPDFIEIVENDELDHKRFGKISFLSGDDKSTWYWLLKNRWAMRYIPDVQVHGFEELPDKDKFFASTLSLMRRWFGNMLRTSGRAIKLGPKPMGFFTWWCLVDQRFSIWTTLIGPTVAIGLTLFVRPSFGLVYLLWVMGTRLLASMLLGLFSGRFSPIWPFLLYYSQIAGAALKSYVSFRFNRQKWTRQGISSGEAADPDVARSVRRESALLHAVATLALIFTVSVSAGILAFPDVRSIQLMASTSTEDERYDDRWFHRALRRVSTDGTMLVPAERVLLKELDLSDVRASAIAGAGPERTRLVLGQTGETIRIGTKEVPFPGKVVCGNGGNACRLSQGIVIRDLTLETRKFSKGLTDAKHIEG